jgi:hypothetical protein
MGVELEGGQREKEGRKYFLSASVQQFFERLPLVKKYFFRLTYSIDTGKKQNREKTK